MSGAVSPAIVCLSVGKRKEKKNQVNFILRDFYKKRSVRAEKYKNPTGLCIEKRAFALYNIECPYGGETGAPGGKMPQGRPEKFCRERNYTMETKHYDIIVAGGGFAGSAAAIAAARKGKKVLLVEKYNCLGGAAAYDLINPFMPYWTNSRKGGRRILLSRGLFEEIVGRLDEEGGLREANKLCFNQEILKYVLMRMALESGAELLFQTYVTGVRREGGKLLSLNVSNVSGTEELSADFYIDATGDGNVAFLAGCPYELGRESDGLCQPMTLCFRLGNVRGAKPSDRGSVGGDSRTAKGNPCNAARINKLYREFQEAGKISNPRENVLIFRTVSDDVLHFNTTRIVRLDPTNARDVTKAEIEARGQVFEMYRFLKENFEEFKDSVLLSTGIQIGVRESRRILGEHVLTQEEMIACTKFEDSVCVCNYDIDIHNPDGAGTSHRYFGPEEYYTIPYRCLVPKDTDNLLVAGRCISATHEAQASLRIMPTCCTLGEAAGTAAALAVGGGIPAREVDVRRLQEELIAGGAKLY